MTEQTEKCPVTYSQQAETYDCSVCGFWTQDGNRMVTHLFIEHSYNPPTAANLVSAACPYEPASDIDKIDTVQGAFEFLAALLESYEMLYPESFTKVYQKAARYNLLFQTKNGPIFRIKIEKMR